jgi:E3 ubiquitin-protein ligase RNF144
MDEQRDVPLRNYIICQKSRREVCCMIHDMVSYVMNILPAAVIINEHEIENTSRLTARKWTDATEIARTYCIFSVPCIICAKPIGLNRIYGLCLDYIGHHGEHDKLPLIKQHLENMIADKLERLPSNKRIYFYYGAEFHAIILRCQNPQCTYHNRPRMCQSLIEFMLWRVDVEDGTAAEKTQLPEVNVNCVVCGGMHGANVHIVECTACHQHGCTVCREPHDGYGSRHKCNGIYVADIPEDVQEYLRAVRATRCPECKQVVEKIDGCDKMTCKCGVYFCYRCGDRLLDGHNPRTQAALAYIHTCPPDLPGVPDIHYRAASPADSDDEDAPAPAPAPAAAVANLDWVDDDAGDIWAVAAAANAAANAAAVIAAIAAAGDIWAVAAAGNAAAAANAAAAPAIAAEPAMQPQLQDVIQFALLPRNLANAARFAQRAWRRRNSAKKRRTLRNLRNYRRVLRAATHITLES